MLSLNALGPSGTSRTVGPRHTGRPNWTTGADIAACTIVALRPSGPGYVPSDLGVTFQTLVMFGRRDCHSVNGSGGLAYTPGENRITRGRSRRRDE